jgi:hypothetical protein
VKIDDTADRLTAHSVLQLRTQSYPRGSAVVIGLLATYSGHRQGIPYKHEMRLLRVGGRLAYAPHKTWAGWLCDQVAVRTGRGRGRAAPG